MTGEPQTAATLPTVPSPAGAKPRSECGAHSTRISACPSSCITLPATPVTQGHVTHPPALNSVVLMSWQSNKTRGKVKAEAQPGLQDSLLPSLLAADG